MSTVLYVLVGVLIFGVLIAVHEGGHFLAARLCGVRVLEFALGMGPLLLQREDRHGTKLSLRALPIGGFCAMEGEDEDSDDPGSFQRAPAWKRGIILLAGVTMNFLLGLLLVGLCYAQAEGFVSPVITSFAEGCPYEGADCLQVGDRFYSINGERIYFTSDVTAYLARRTGDTSDITVIRDGEKITLEDYPMVPVEYIDEETGETVLRYGFTFSLMETGFWAHVKYAWYGAMDFVRMVRLGLHDLITGAVGLRQMTGVVGIVGIIADVGTSSPTAHDAALNIAYLTAFISVNLAVMNLLPIPALDGGKLVFLLVSWVSERVFRRRIEPKIEAYISSGCLVLLMGLMVFVMFNDILRLISG